MLGPDYITDEIVVETSDHARLSVRYAVNDHFNVCSLEACHLSFCLLFQMVVSTRCCARLNPGSPDFPQW
jgi:hypothetical protein